MDMTLTEQCREQGYCVLPSVFTEAEIEIFRAATTKDLGRMGRTRGISHSYHLAGFHRFPSLTAIHTRITENDRLTRFLTACYGDTPYYALGLSDITVNRSQHWHTDLLRGRYSHFLDHCTPWSKEAGVCLKALVYLQDGSSLRLVPRSHLSPLPLDDAALECLADTEDDIVRVEVRAGDVVMMDIRALHRGSTDDDMRSTTLVQHPKILVSTVFGPIASPLSCAMAIGNAHRMADWDRLYLNG